MLNVFEIAKVEERPGADRAWFVIDPSVMYPAVLRHIAQVTTRPPEPLGVLFDQQVQQFPVNALCGLGLVPFSAGVEGDPAVRQMRGAALEIGRLWFTELLQVAVGGPVGLHILKNEDWRL